MVLEIILLPSRKHDWESRLCYTGLHVTWHNVLILIGFVHIKNPSWNPHLKEADVSMGHSRHVYVSKAFETVWREIRHGGSLRRGTHITGEKVILVFACQAESSKSFVWLSLYRLLYHSYRQLELLNSTYLSHRGVRFHISAKLMAICAQSSAEHFSKKCFWSVTVVGSRCLNTTG